MKMKPLTDSYLLNGVVHGPVAANLLQCNGDLGYMRPYIDPDDGNTYVALLNGETDKEGNPLREPVMVRNDTGIFFYDEWKDIDRVMIRAGTPRLKAWADLRAANQYTVPGGWAKLVVESQVVGDITPAEVNMDVAMSDQDFPVKDFVGVPLPIIHKDAKISARQLAVSRQGNLPLDTTYVELASIKVAEEIEKFTVGVGIAYSFAGNAIYGYTNFPGRLTIELSDPTDAGWTPGTLINELISMRLAAEDVGFYGPFRVYMGRGWSAVLDADYSEVKGDNTLRQRALNLDGIQSIQTLDYLPEYDIVMVQLGDARTARAVVAMDMTTMQWTQLGGLEIFLKIMAIMVPQLRADFYGGVGLIHGTVTAAGS